MKTLPLVAAALFAASPAMAQDNYRALGTEPFWSLSIGRTTITYRPANGRPLTVARPRPIIGINGELYRARGITVDITHVRCSDGMSDRTYADTVRLTIGRRQLSGCGGEIVAGDTLLAGTRWRITAIDGARLNLARPASVAFTADRIEGQICNGYGGPYRLARGTLIAGPVIATQMACGGRLGEAEAAFFRALRQPLKVHRGDSNTLVLSKRWTSVTLHRDR